MSSDPSSLKGYRRIAPSSSAVVCGGKAATPPEQRRAFSRVRTPRRALLLDSDDVAVPIVELDPDTQVPGIFPADVQVCQHPALNNVERSSENRLQRLKILRMNRHPCASVFLASPKLQRQCIEKAVRRRIINGEESKECWMSDRPRRACRPASILEGPVLDLEMAIRPEASLAIALRRQVRPDRSKQ